MLRISEEALIAFDETLDEKISSDIKAGYEELFGSIGATVGGSWQKVTRTSESNKKGIIRELTKTEEVSRSPGIKKLAYIYQIIDRSTILDIEGNSICEPIEIPTGKTREVEYTEKLAL